VDVNGQGWIVHLDNERKVKKEKLAKVAKGDKCRINNLEHAAKNLGLERSVNEGLCRELDYHARRNSCGHFVTECVYGQAFSEQADAVDGSFVAKIGTNLLSSSNRTN